MLLRSIPIVLLVSVLLPAGGIAQTDRPYEESEDTRYFDFWPGYWAEVAEGRPDTTLSTFRVRRGVHPTAFEEEWVLVSSDR